MYRLILPALLLAGGLRSREGRIKLHPLPFFPADACA